MARRSIAARNKARNQQNDSISTGTRTKQQKHNAEVPFVSVLPLELRLKIYASVFGSQPPKNLRFHFKAPTLAVVCKQIRSEALPGFFSESQFVASVDSNIGIGTQDLLAKPLPPLAEALKLGTAPPDLGRTPYYYRELARSGVLKLDLYTSRWLSRIQIEEGIDVVFRKLQLYVACVIAAPQGGAGYTGPDSTAMVQTMIRPKARMELSIMYQKVQGQVEMAVVEQQIVKAARGIADGTENFKGFRLRDLQVLAEACRYWPV